MKITKLRIGLLLGGIVVVAGLIYAFSQSSNAQTFTTTSVTRGALNQTVEVTGELKSVTDLSLSFETSGAVTSIFVDIGDSVKKGDVLAELNTGELGAAAEQAKQSVAAAQAELTVVLTGVSSEQEAIERANVAVAQARFDSATTDFTAAVTAQTVGDDQDSASVASVLADFEQVDAQNEESISQAAEDLSTALSAGLITVRAGLETADQVLGVENTLLNLEYEPYVGVLDTNTLINAKEQYELAADERDRAEDEVLALTEDSSEADVILAYSRVSLALSKTASTLLYTSRVLGASMSDSGTFSNADLVALRATIAAERSTVASGISALQTAKQSYDTVLRQAEDRLTDAQNALTLAQAQQASGESLRWSNVLKAQAALAVQTASLTQAQAQLNKVLAEPREVDLAGLRASVARAEAEYSAALARLRKAQVVAPIDGVVSDIFFSVGEQVSPGQTMIAEIAEDDAFEIVLDVPEADVVKLAIGQEAEITFDAFGDRVKFIGSVYSINPAQKIISDVVFYEAKIVLSTDQDLSALKPGMSADVVVSTRYLEDVLILPTRTVLLKGNEPYVRVVKNENEYEEVNVVTGLRADDGLIEIVSGVSEGQEIVVSIKTE